MPIIGIFLTFVGFFTSKSRASPRFAPTFAPYTLFIYTRARGMRGIAILSEKFCCECALIYLRVHGSFAASTD